MTTTLLVTAYLAAIVAANWIVSVWGPAASILTAFVLIGLIVTTRDRLHDAWGANLRRNMGALILGGSAISLLLGSGVTRIALASGAAFLVSESVDAFLYHFLRRRGWYERVNGSNAASSLVDSILFPWIAFGGLMPFITLGQWAAKTFGGAIWSWVLRPRQLATFLLLAVAAPASSQVSVGVGEYHNEFITQTVIESAVLFPSVVGITPNAIISASAGPWDDYKHWEPHVAARVLAFIRGPWKAVTIVSWQPWNEWGRAVVVKIDYTLWQR